MFKSNDSESVRRLKEEGQVLIYLGVSTYGETPKVKPDRIDAVIRDWLINKLYI